MDQSAIDTIASIATARDINATNEARMKRDAVPILCIPKDHELTNTEKYEFLRTRLRGQFTTPSLAAFTAYCNNRDDFTLFINRDSMAATAIFNLGDDSAPGHCDDIAALHLKKTSTFIALEAIASGRKISQRDFAEWLEDFTENITPLDANGDPYEIKEAINAVRNVTIEKAQEITSTENNLSQKRTAMEEIEAKSKEFTLPSEIAFTCEPWSELQSRSFSARISVLTGDGIEFKIRLADISKAEDDMALELQNKLETGVTATDVKTYIGTYAP